MTARQMVKQTLNGIGMLGAARRLVYWVKALNIHSMERWLLLKHRLKGGSYLTFYEELMDRRATKGVWLTKPPEAVTGWPTDPHRNFAPKFFVDHGYMTPQTEFLDYGCGGVATGVNFIKVLDVGKYVGCDISSEVLRVGQDWITKYGLESKRPTLIHVPDGNLGALGDRKFDMIYAQEVIVHLRPEIVKKLIRDIWTFLKPGGSFFLTYSDTGRDKQYKYGSRVRVFHYNVEFFKECAEGLPLEVSQVTEFDGQAYRKKSYLKLLRIRRVA